MSRYRLERWQRSILNGSGMCPWVRELELVCGSGVFVLNENSVIGEQSCLDVRVRGPGNTETSWKWGGQEWGRTDEMRTEPEAQAGE